MNCRTRVKKARLIQGWSKRKLARKAKTDSSSLAAYEQGNRDISLKMMKRLATALEVTVGWLGGFYCLPEENLAQKVKKYRLIKAWTQKEMAQKIGLGRTTIQKIESGQTKNPNQTTMNKLKNIIFKF
ncbi:helix-turn-helix domain-containing protein [Fuchsiella alkaliacetigena]|uniref:helix-turn-helix domain-containing protein n=1 Tax=Fuchsiella alkaliacetigena TaxID=957042 RepID=UPI00200AC2EA|nr:helix-turn-helix transcriptional regulator [Fuchsiella alkaliacetigena]MCK8826050.1 helix-turn-helix transcriptional regulator [Fuchsiella alkaliacetigena]